MTLEITAGQGSNLGYRFEHIAESFDATKESDRLRVCFDTEHAFAAGYDIRTKEGYERTFAEFDETIGIELLAAFHLNDSKKNFTPASTVTSISAKASSASKHFGSVCERQALLGSAHVLGNARRDRT